MPAAIELAVREIEAPARDELQIVDELSFGRSLADSLEALQRRLPSREIAVLMTTLMIQQRAGGDVVRALHELSSTLDGRRETLREVRTLMAGAVFTSYMVPVLGLASLLLLNAINSKTLDRMTTSPVGIAALVVAAMLYALGGWRSGARRGWTCDRSRTHRPGGRLLLRGRRPRAHAAARPSAVERRELHAEVRDRRRRGPTRAWSTCSALASVPR